MTSAPETVRLRASNAARSRTAARVQRATRDGLLTAEEGEERLAGVQAARFEDELVPLVADLSPRRPSGPSVRHALVALAVAVWASITRHRWVSLVLLVVVVGAVVAAAVLADSHGFGHGGFDGRPHRR